MVAVSISPKGEMIRNAQQGVGEVHSTDDVKDSITFNRGKAPCCMQACSGQGKTLFLH